MIIKTKQTSEFAQIKNATLRDKRLDLDTRGALSEILTYSENFEADVPGLMTLFGIGREKLLKITNQLKEHGYLEIKPIHNKQGRMIDKEWIFYGVSQEVNFRQKEKTEEHQDAGKPNDGSHHDTGLPNVGQNRTTENPHDLFKQESLKKYEEKDLKTHTKSETRPETGNGYKDENLRVRDFSPANGIPQNKTVLPIAEISPHEKLPDKSAYAEPIWRYLEKERMDTPFENPNWKEAIEYAYKRGFTTEEFTGTINFLKTDPEQKKWRRGRITAQIVTNNLQVYFDLLQQQKPNADPPVSDISKCSECDIRGLIKVEIDGIKRMARCSHPGVKKAA